jgi:hypothetical protein
MEISFVFIGVISSIAERSPTLLIGEEQRNLLQSPAGISETRLSPPNPITLTSGPEIHQFTSLDFRFPIFE